MDVTKMDCSLELLACFQNARKVEESICFGQFIRQQFHRSAMPVNHRMPPAVRTSEANRPQGGIDSTPILQDKSRVVDPDEIAIQFRWNPPAALEMRRAAVEASHIDIRVPSISTFATRFIAFIGTSQTTVYESL